MGEIFYPTGSSTVFDSRVPMWRTQPMQQQKTGPVVPPPAGSPAEPPVVPVVAPPAPVVVTDGGDDVSPDVSDRGFPAKTPIKDMTVEQQLAYFKFQDRKKADTLKSRADYDDLRTFKENAEAAALSDHDKAIKAARDEGRNSAITEAGSRAAAAIYRANLQARGKDAAALELAAKAFNANAFIDSKTGDVDTDGIAAFVTSIFGPPGAFGGGNGPQWPDMGQGNHVAPPSAPGAAGLAEAKRRGFITA